MHTEIVRRVVKLAFLLVAATGIAAAQAPPGATQNYLNVTSTAFSDGAAIPPKHTCGDPNAASVSPPLQWSGAPKEAASFVLIVHDLETRPNKRVANPLHWLLWNLPADAHGLPEGVPPKAQLPDGSRQGAGYNGKIGFQGPCPRPPTLHHYLFDVYAVDQMLDLPPTATRSDVEKGIDGHIVGHGVLIGTVRR